MHVKDLQSEKEKRKLCNYVTGVYEYVFLYNYYEIYTLQSFSRHTASTDVAVILYHSTFLSMTGTTPLCLHCTHFI